MAARISEADFEEKVIRAELPVLVDFYSDSCVACKKLAPVLGDLEDNYENKLLVYKVNTNYDAALAERFAVMANPTLLLFRKGQSIGRKVGAKNYEELSTWIDTNI